MKKFYTLLAAVACVATASAATFAAASTNWAEKAELQSGNVIAATINVTDYAPAKAAPVEGTWNVLGNGTVSENVVYDINPDLGAKVGDRWEVVIEQSAEDANWYRTIIYNENAPTFEMMGEADTNYFYFNIADASKVYSDPINIYGAMLVYQMVPESGVAEFFDPASALVQNINSGVWYGKYENGTITFPQRSFGYLDLDAGSLYYNNKAGEFAITLPGYTMPEFWTELGTANFVDGLTHWYFLAQTDDQIGQWPVEGVTASQSVLYPNLVRLNTPWMDIWEYATENLVIDLADPENVAIDMQSTGINTEDGMFWLVNAAGFGYYGANAVAAGLMPSTYDAATRTITIPAGGMLFCFVVDGAVPESWSYFPVGSGYDFDTVIVLPEAAGVEDVVVSDENAAVVFYNLQGVQVANPTSGVYVRVQGGNATKVLVK